MTGPPVPPSDDPAGTVPPGQPTPGQPTPGQPTPGQPTSGYPPPGYPPPGSTAPGSAASGGVPPGWPAPTPGQWPPPAPGPAYAAPAPIALGRPLHKPGTVPLRPLTLADFFDGAFATIRRNPKATIGMGALVTAGFMVLPVIGTLVLGMTGNLIGLDDAATGSATAFSDAGVFLASLLGGLFGFLANTVVAGLIVPVVTRATLGERITAGDAWHQARARLPRLVGLAFLELLLLVLLIGVPLVLAVLAGSAIGNLAITIAVAVLVGILAALAALAVHTRWFQLAAPTLVVERRGIFAAIARSGRLSTGQFWRILGILLLVAITTGFVSQVISIPFSIIGGLSGILVPGSTGTVVLLLSSNVASVVSGAIVGPFSGAVAVLQYLDQRFRKEGFDIELINHVQARRPAG